MHWLRFGISPAPLIAPARFDAKFTLHRDMAAAKAFFESSKVVSNITPDRVATNGHDSYPVLFSA